MPGRPAGVRAPAAISSGDEDAVAIQPGATAFTVTPRGASSSAIPRISPSMPALAAPYAAEPGSAVRGPVIEETITMRP